VICVKTILWGKTMVASDTTDDASGNDVFDGLDDFISKTFPMTYKRLLKEKKTLTAEFLEDVDKDFSNKLVTIIDSPTKTKTRNRGRRGFTINSFIKKIKKIFRH
jgi:hypothetical protein